MSHAGGLASQDGVFCRPHSSLRETPGMAAGLASHAWEIGELLT